MNAAQIHLALNHAPLILSIVGAIILLFGMILKNNSFKILSLFFVVTAALFAAPVFLTGEGTEELVEHLPGVNETAIEDHEEMAKISLVIIIVTGVAALAGLIFRKKTNALRIALPVVLILSLISFGAMARTAHLGGLIRHAEIQTGAQSGSTENEENENQEQKEDVSIEQKTNVPEDSIQQKKDSHRKDDDD
jgi:uncharacterized membrane protein